MFEREILNSSGGSWLRFRCPFGLLLGASGRLGPHLGAKVPTPPNEQKLENQGSQNPEKSEDGGTGTKLWGYGKTANSEKSIAKVSLNTEENANPAK